MALTRAAVLLFGLITLVLALPHTGMINTDHVRDVGVVFSEAYYKGNSTFLLQAKAEPSCVPLNCDLNVASVQICLPDICCNFFPSADCTTDVHNQDLAFSVREGDVQEVPGGLGAQSCSYLCGSEGTSSSAGIVAHENVLKTTPHDASKEIKVDMDV